MRDPEIEKAILSMLPMISEMHQDMAVIKMETANLHRIFYKVKDENPEKRQSKKQVQKQDLESRMTEEKIQVIKKIIQSQD